MNYFSRSFYGLLPSTVLLMGAVMAGCSGGTERDPVFGDNNVAVRAPESSAGAPLDNATNVSVNSANVTASFTQPVVPAAGGATFSLTCTAPCVSPAGAAALSTDGTLATFTLAPGVILDPLTQYTVTVSGYQSAASGLPLVTPNVWSFTTGAAPPDVTPPTVSTTSPIANATGVATNRSIAASFSEPMNPLSITDSTFTVSCPAGTPISGAVAYSTSGATATFTPASALPASTSCAVTISIGVTDVANNAMTSAFSWSFTTGAGGDTTAPTVQSTNPVANATSVAINTRVTATFSEPMDPATITAATFSLRCPSSTAVAGTVAYAVNGNVATFTPTAALAAGTLCTALISTGVRDSASNAMASAFSWSFQTGGAADTTAPTVLSTNPANAAIGVCITKTLNATFSEPMDPLTLTAATIKLAATAGGAVTGVIAYDAATNIVTFDPVADLTGTPATQYTATIVGSSSGVKDIAGNALASNKVTTFTTNASSCTTAPVLGAAAPFGSFGGNATLTNDGLATVINGDIGVNASSTSVTGLRDAGGNVYTISPDNNGMVNGLIYTLTAPPASVAGLAVTETRSDALIAFNSISPLNLPGGIDVSSLAQCPSCGGAGGGPDELAGRTLPPGVYKSTTGAYDIGGTGRTTADLVLDAGGDTNAVWVFQSAAGTGTLNVGLTGPTTPAVPIHVQLINGAQSRNVFWYVPAGAVIGTGATMVGTLLADASITMSTTGGSPPTAVITTLNGRAIALTAGVTMTNTVVNVPAP